MDLGVVFAGSHVFSDSWLPRETLNLGQLLRIKGLSIGLKRRKHDGPEPCEQPQKDVIRHIMGVQARVWAHRILGPGVGITHRVHVPNNWYSGFG